VPSRNSVGAPFKGTSDGARHRTRRDAYEYMQRGKIGFRPPGEGRSNYGKVKERADGTAGGHARPGPPKRGPSRHANIERPERDQPHQKYNWRAQNCPNPNCHHGSV
jgi:hypothetical protein